MPCRKGCLSNLKKVSKEVLNAGSFQCLKWFWIYKKNRGVQHNSPQPQAYSTLIVLTFVSHFQVDGYVISWKHIVYLYEEHIEINRIGTTGSRRLPKNREEHINLTPRHRMKVKLAAQVTKLI